MSRAREARAARRAQQFAKFRLTELNLIPLVDTFVSIVFFALTTSTVGELAPVVAGVNLPESRVGAVAHQQMTLGIGGQITLGEEAIMSTLDAARAQSNDPTQPLLIPRLYNRLRQLSDSIRREKNIPRDQSVDVPLAVQGDKTMRYDLLARVMQTARLAGFRSISLQVNKVQGEDATQASR
ncbi:MAG TPA: biopolymer transporter ExbD [Gemmatimonadaceae bacterium]|nr:biopolymer transporter ExbD [Gemmatimonadaceae bacterium]